MGIFSGYEDKIVEAIKTNDYGRLPESLRKALSGIDSQYTLNPFGEVELNMPPTLGLDKLDFKGKTDGELSELAKQYLAASYAGSFEKIQNDYLKNVNSSNVKKDTELQNLDAKLLKAEEGLTEQKQKAEHAAIKSGLARSSIKDERLKDIGEAVEKAKDQLSSEAGIRLETINRQIENLGEQKLDALKSLDIEHALKIDARINELVKQENTAREAVLKYNNTIGEKEAAYQRTLQTAYDAAVKAKYDNSKRLMDMAAALGENHVTELKQQDKLDAVKKFISDTGMSDAEALAFVSGDGVFKEQLGAKFYGELESWIKGGRA